MSIITGYDTTEERLKKIEAAVADNTKILRSMRRNTRMVFFMHILYWVFILGLGVSAYYYVEPYLKGFKELYTDVKTQQEKLGSVKESWMEKFEKIAAPFKKEETYTPPVPSN